MATRSPKINRLHGWAQFTLFVTSYLPLFILIIIRQVFANIEYHHWDFTAEGMKTFITKFGLSTLLGLISLFGWIGYTQTFGKIEEVAKNGFPATVMEVQNKNSEAIGYIATYIIPFLFEAFDSWYNCIAVLLLLAIIYRIYINSSLLLINPVLSFRFAIYEIEYEVMLPSTGVV
jgi:hypothetical protein